MCKRTSLLCLLLILITKIRGESSTQRPCDEDPCEADHVDWISSEWSDCDVACGSSIQTRTVLCATQEGKVFPDEQCHSYRRPNTSRICESHRGCDAQWFTSEWSKCSVSCGNGTKTRHVFCGAWDDDQVITHNDKNCTESEKPIDTMECENDPCEALWYTGPWEMCSGSCIDGQKTRVTVCIHEDDSQCDDSTQPSAQELCNTNSTCDDIDDGMMMMGGCFNSTYGCCPDGQTEKGKNFENCPPLEVPGGCKVSEFGCCTDDKTAAFGPFRLGCPVTCNATKCAACETSEFGCCPDGQTPAEGKNNEGCEEFVTVEPRVESDCVKSKYGCCDDNKTEAKGPNKEGCDDIDGSGDIFGSGDGENGTITSLSSIPPDGSTPDELTSDGSTPDELSSDGSTPDELTSDGSTPDVSTPDGSTLGGSTPSDCISTTFGCCQDGMTPAEGENYLGCDDIMTCNETEFGCCPDNTTWATGPDFDGCEPTSKKCTDVDCVSTPSTPMIDCKESEFGCCPDNVSAPTGPNNEGCPCHLLPFGCCPDNKSPAKGERFYGCTCKEYPHGCCQDNYTPARGPGFDGCLCNRMLYGCCPDGYTPAAGQNYDGCGCDRAAFGCCPDGQTAARGPNYEGCPCEMMPYGCCSDRKTPATGPDNQGCPCNSTPYGCCPDGTTTAKGPRYEGCRCVNTPYGCCPNGVSVSFGPKFEGCPDGPELDTKLSAEACALPKERGSCRNYVVKWYYDIVYGGCLRFWFGGCDGNANRFPSQEECERICVAPEGTQVCLLPKVKGPCEGNNVAWYFDHQSKQCGQFYYGGCLGNKNRFETREACESLCMHQDLLDTCDQPMEPGPCRGTHIRFYYDKRENNCKEFTYGGCRGNKNNFASERECRETCGALSPTTICTLPKAEGRCLGAYPRWFYDYQTGSCQEFTYTGCDGNRNRFVDKAGCESMCSNVREPTVHRPTPSAPLPPTMPTAGDICSLEKSEGPCQNYALMWYFNKERKRCEQFYYGGCEGNDNRFDSRGKCEMACISPPPADNVCALEKEPGNCFNFQERWYFDIEEQQCHRFYYSGCSGNGNNFASFEECEERCESKRSTTTEMAPVDFKTEYCFLTPNHGPCEKNEILWYYDSGDGVCKQFYYGGCDGNFNRFSSRKECETRCWNSQDICKLPKVKGPCSGSFIQWHYNKDSNECEEFQYGGCQGNGNRFSSEDACESQCKQKKELGPALPEPAGSQVDICQLLPNPGPCKAYLPHYYYSSSDKSCRLFIYGGCEGNENRFSNRRDCEDRCFPKSVEHHEEAEEEPSDENQKEVICREEVDPGSCSESHPRWFYDAQASTCMPFVYGGCGGNKNNFKALDNCMRYCGNVRPMQQTPECVDSPSFSNCALVVKVQYCNNKHYAKFCCRSCLTSGQIDVSQVNELLS